MTWDEILDATDDLKDHQVIRGVGVWYDDPDRRRQVREALQDMDADELNRRLVDIVLAAPTHPLSIEDHVEIVQWMVKLSEETP